MFKKGYIIIFLLFLTLLGISTQQQIVVPNQQIVLQFTNDGVASETIQNVLVVVKKQLQDFGVSNIKVKEGEKGTLKITYYSKEDVAIIKGIFAKDSQLKIDYTLHRPKNSRELPNKNESVVYNVDVYEIQNTNDVDWDFNGVNVKVYETKSNRFLDPNTFYFANNYSVANEDNSAKISYKIHKNIALAIDEILYKIPEVRAGPSC